MLQSQHRNPRLSRKVPRKPRLPRLERLEERQLLAAVTIPVTSNAGDTSANTLYNAIMQSNANDPGPGGHNTITFNLGSSGAQTIVLKQALPALTFPVTIDGTTEPGYVNSPLVFVDGSSAAGDGFTVNASNVTIKGLDLGNFSGSAIIVNNVAVTNTLITRDYIGVDTTGSFAKPNGHGITINNSSGNTITNNVVSGSSLDEIDLSNSNNNLIQGNRIGTNAAGTIGLDQGWDAIKLSHSSNNTIGGVGPGLGNVLSGAATFYELEINDAGGVSTGNLVVGNMIGTNAAGTAAALTNPTGVPADGVLLNGLGTTGNTIGGTAVGARNVISGNANGVDINAPNNFVIANLIGTNAAGNAAIPNSNDGVQLRAANATLGGTGAGEGNVISGNKNNGVETVFLSGGGVQVVGNFIGTDITGTVALPNGTVNGASANGSGVRITGGSGVTVGGTAGGSRNVISGNTVAGVEFTGGSGVAVLGNYIGTDVSGTTAVGNGLGIFVNGGSGISIGGTSSAARNIISGNRAANGFAGNGVQISSSGTGANVITGNYIGTDVNGTTAVANGGSGISISNSSNDTIGGVTATPGTAPGNVISGNAADGIQMISNGTGLTIQGNLIGTGIGGTANLGNGGDGIRLSTSNNLVGGTVLGAGNVIAFNGSGNGGDGIHVLKVTTAPTGDVFEQNSIFSNNALGISLTTTGTTALPLGPPATPTNPSENNHINYPVLTQALFTSGTTTITGALTQMRPNTAYNIEFYQSTTADPTGFGEGQTLIGVQNNVHTDGSGAALFTAILNSGLVKAGTMLTATATDAALQDGTSEFSQAVPIQAQVDLSLQIQANPTTVYAGQTVTYTVTVTNNGTTDAHNVAITDTLPNGIGPNVSASDNINGSANVTFNSNDVIDTLPLLMAGQSVTLTITVVPTQANVPSMIDSAIVTSTDQNTDANNSGSVTVQVKPVVPLKLTVTPNPDPVLVGQTLSYTVKLQNLNNTFDATGVVFTDTLDPNVKFNALTSSAGLVQSGTTLTDTIGTIPAGQTVTLTINVVPQASAVDSMTDLGSVTNTASEAYNESASDPNDPNAPQSVDTTTTVRPSIDLSVAFVPVPTPNPVPVEQPLTYTVVVTNNGLSTANNVVLTDVLDSNVTFVPGASTPTWSASGQTLTAGIGQLAAGNSATLTLVVTPTSAAINPVTNQGSVSNQASVTGSETDVVANNNAATVSVAVTPIAVLTISGAGSQGTVIAGKSVTYTFTITNTGPSTANNVRFTDPIPLTANYVSSTSDHGTPPSDINNTVVANLGPLAPNETATVTVTLQPNGQAGNNGSITDTASVIANESPSGQPAPSTSVTTKVTPAADLSVSIQASPNPVLVQTGLNYVITATNSGPSDASDVVVTDTLDPSVAVGTISTSQGTFAQSGSMVTVDFGKIPAGATATLTISVTPQTAGAVTNTATVKDNAAGETDPNPANDSSSISTPVTPSTDLKLQLSGNPVAIQTGDDVVYTATVTNNGPSAATGVTINDTIPLGATLVSVVPSAGGSFNVTGGVVSASFPSLALGESASVTIDVVLSNRGNAVDTATVAGNELDPNLSNNSATATTSVQSPPGIFDFLAPTSTVNNNAGVATITVVRTDGLQGNVTVHYTTGGGSAKPGLDYTPVSGTLNFLDGQSSQSFTVPVLPYAFNRGDISLGLSLSSPTGGATLGPQNQAQLTIHVLNPDVTPPTVSNIAWFGVGTGSSAIVLNFSKPMDAASVSNVNNYQLIDTGRDTLAGTRDDSRVGIASASYNPTDNSVVLVPATPLRPGEFYYLKLNGSSGAPVADIVGNPLAGSGSAGTDYALSFGTGSRLTYIDAGNNQVNLIVRGPGALNLTRFPNGQGNVLQIVRPVPHRTTLLASLRRNGRVGGSGTTSFTAITGLGNFGDVRVRMSTPPFFVSQPSFATTRTALPAAAHTAAVPAAALHAVRGGAFVRHHR